MSDDEGDAVAASLLALARILFSGKSVELTLDAVAHLAQQTIPGCDSASVTVVEGGRATTTVSTSELAWDIDQHQYRTGQGPCLDAVRQQAVVRVDSFGDERRWPELTPAAVERGARSSLSLPLVVLDEAVGALNLYSRAEAGFAAGEAVGQVFATQAAITIANATALRRATELAGNLSVALEHRDVIGQAKGILMAQSDLSAEEAFDVLRRASQRSNRKLHELARDVIEKRASLASEQ